MKKYTLEINGFKSYVQYYQEDIEQIFKPLIKKIENIQKEKKRRIIVYIAAPAGLGKSTLASFLQLLAGQMGYNNIDVCGIDGFHYYNDYLMNNYVEIEGKQVLMKTVKGNELTFDVDKLIKTVQDTIQKDTKWPFYDRNIHNPREEVIEVTKDIVLLEGNYLLLNKGKWDQLTEYCDYSIFLSCQEEMLKARLVGRKVKGGLDPKAAEEWYYNSDRKNVLTVLNYSKKADLTLLCDGYKYNIKQGDKL